MSGSIALALCVLLHFVTAENLTADMILRQFQYLHKDVANEMANKMNAVNNLDAKQKECEKLHKLHEQYFLQPGGGRVRYHTVVDESIVFKELERVVHRSCIELVYYKRFADELFSLLPQKKIVSLNKAAELKSLWVRIDKGKRKYAETVGSFDAVYKSRINPEKFRKMRKKISDAYGEAYRKVQDFVNSKLKMTI